MRAKLLCTALLSTLACRAAAGTLVAVDDAGTARATLIRIDTVTGRETPIMGLGRNVGPVYATDFAGSRLFVSSYDSGAGTYGVKEINFPAASLTGTNLPPRPYEYYDATKEQLVTARWDAGSFVVSAFSIETGAEHRVGTFSSTQPVYPIAFDATNRTLYFGGAGAYFYLLTMNMDTGAVTNTGFSTRLLTTFTVLKGRLFALQHSETHRSAAFWTVVEVELPSYHVTPLVPLGYSLQFHLLRNGDPDTERLIVVEQLNTTGGYAIGIVDIGSRQWARLPYEGDGTFDYTFVAAAAHANVPAVTLSGAALLCATLALIAVRAVRSM